MAKRDRAAYMREYRARREAAGIVEFGYDGPTDADLIAELEQEIRHLKEELAKRPEPGGIRPKLTAVERYDQRPIRPVPKHR
jgi:hypothetical protein